MFDDEDKSLIDKSMPFVHLGTFLVLLIVLYFVSSGSAKLFPKGGTYLSEDSLKESVCLQGFRSIVDKQADPSLVSGEIIKILEEQNYTNFKVKVSDIFRPSLIGDKCKLVTKDKLGLRGFMVKLKKDLSYPANYLVDDIDEVKLQNEGF